MRSRDFWPAYFSRWTLRHRRLRPEEQLVVVLGASPKPTRYSHQAVRLLHAQGYRVVPVHPRAARVDQIPAVRDLSAIREPVHTLTLYVGPQRSRGMLEDIISLSPGRVILNPGTESRDLEYALKDAKIPHERACTLVLLRTGQF